MKAKKFFIIIFFICILISGCNFNTINIEKNDGNIYTFNQDIQKILDKEGMIDFNEEFFLGSIGDEIITKKEDSEKNIIIKTNINNNKKYEACTLPTDKNIFAIESFGEWIIWSETDDEDFKVGVSLGLNWILKAYNIHTQEYIIIDKESENLPKNRNYLAAPYIFDVYNNLLVYTAYNIYNNTQYQLLILFDLSDKSKKIINEIQVNEKLDIGFGAPNIYNENIAYSIQKLNDDFTTDTDSYMYSIDKDFTEKIGDHFCFNPILGEKYIVMQYKPNGENINSGLRIYDYNGNLIEYIDNTYETYSETSLKPSEMWNYKIYKDYLVWENGGNGAGMFHMFDISNKKMYEIIGENSDKILSGIHSFSDGVLIWSELLSNNTYITKYIKLKEN